MSEYIEKVLNSEISLCEKMLEECESPKSVFTSEAHRAEVTMKWQGSLDTAIIIKAKLKGAEVEPVVHCKDCIYDNTFSCPLSFIENHNLCFTNHDPDFYCAKGRKEGEDE